MNNILPTVKEKRLLVLGMAASEGDSNGHYNNKLLCSLLILLSLQISLNVFCVSCITMPCSPIYDLHFDLHTKHMVPYQYLHGNHAGN